MEIDPQLDLSSSDRTLASTTVDESVADSLVTPDVSTPLPGAPENTPHPPRRRKRRRRRRRLRKLLRRGRPLAVVGAAVILLGLIWAGLQSFQAYHAYQDSLRSVRTLRAYSGRSPSSFTAADIHAMQLQFDDLNRSLSRLQRATSVPIGESLVNHLPWIGPRYKAARQTMRVGLLLSEAGRTGAGVGSDTLSALDASGLAYDPSSPQPTWLDAVSSHDGELVEVAAQVEQAKTIRARINTRMLPLKVQRRLPDLDRALDRFDYNDLVNQQLPVIEAAMGAGGPVRYLVEFPNPAELRPGGGYPGTMALITINHGQLESYSIFDSHDISEQLMAVQTTTLPQPWPMAQYINTNYLLLQDANWWADFPRSAQTIMQMYAQLGQPPLTGVIDAQPPVIADLLTITGQLTIDVDGEQRTITPDNVYEEIERQRRLRRSGARGITPHKEVLETIGLLILDDLKQGHRSDLTKVINLMSDAADRRDIEFFSSDTGVEGWLDQRAWSGRLIPNPSVPTLAVSFGNLVSNKASLRMEPSIELSIGPPENGRRQVTADIFLQHTGTREEDPFYAGFMRWWVEVQLPAGATLESSNTPSQPDPDAPNGGSYLVELFPQQRGYVAITFSMPDNPLLLIRRQPGVNPIALRAGQPGCNTPLRASVTQDVVVSLPDLCR